MSAVAKSAVTGRSSIAGARNNAVANRNRFRSVPDLHDASAYQVTQPVHFKRQPTLAAIILSLRAAAPAAVSSLTLYGLARAFDISTSEYLSTLTVLVTVLSIFLLQPGRSAAAELLQPRWKIVAGLLGRWVTLLAVLFAIGYVTRYVPHYSRPVIVAWALATPVLLIAATLGLNEIARRVVCRPHNCRSVVFVGCNETSMYLAARFARHPELCMSVRGFFDDRNQQRLDAPELELLGQLADLPAFVKQHAIDVIFISLPMRHIRRVHDLLDGLSDTTVSLYYLPDVVVSDLLQARTGEILGVPVIAMRETPFHGYRAFAKRAMDVTISSGVLLFMAPVLLLVALGIKLTSSGPVLFRQRRYGLDGREITIYKLRTMTVAEDSGWLTQASPGDARVTSFGRFLRRWSLDEFPQLINVLQGRMSLVGPRPHAIAHNEEYRRLIKGYMIRHKVPPGITGLAQVKGFRGPTPRLQDMQGRVHYDLEYLHNWSLMLDLKILLMTIPKLFQTDKAY
jgi:putative colanic acid biosysnthesis UDP-glucose lipid carrier transferase